MILKINEQLYAERITANTNSHLFLTSTDTVVASRMHLGIEKNFTINEGTKMWR